MSRVVAHVPMVVLPKETSAIPLAEGTLRAIPYDDWYSYDGNFPFAQSQYESTAPVFLVLDRPPSTSDAFDALVDASINELSGLHQALLIATGRRLIPPSLSMMYFLWDNDADLAEHGVSGSVTRYVGPCNRELIIFGNQLDRVLLTPVLIRLIHELEALLATPHAPLNGLIDALVRTGRHSYSSLNESLHLIAGLETLLVRRGEPLTATFARRFSVISGSDDAQMNESDGRLLYQIRSDLMHGREIEPSEASEEFLEWDIRLLACHIALRTLRWLGRAKPSLDAFYTSLDKAFSNVEDFVALQHVFGDAKS